MSTQMTPTQWAKHFQSKARRMTDPAAKALMLERAQEWQRRAQDTRTNVEFVRIGWMVACTWREGNTYHYQLNGEPSAPFKSRHERDAALKAEVNGD